MILKYNKAGDQVFTPGTLDFGVDYLNVHTPRDPLFHKNQIIRPGKSECYRPELDKS